ncbi:traB domain-containing protein [Ipomoea triloba]|uniref:traB domain-containing protein n=1 Tax=Ipomoea triloba TaxID=35885 RepID=UPI00125D3A6E|nr:traB domain-containing protein [Ipomoea triloba]
MHRLIRTPLAFLNSSESTRILSLAAPSLRRFSHLRSLAAVSLIPKPPSTQSLRHSRPPLCADAMDSHPLSASGIEDFVHVDGAGAGAGAVADSNFQPEGSEESVVADAAVEEVEPQGYMRKMLPEELSKSVVMLNCDSSAEGGACDVYLLGTAHVSSESCEEVRAAINFLKPQVVFLELCSSRIAILTPQNLKIPTMGEMVEMWKKNHNLFAILYSWFLAKVASKLEVFPGAEFRVAYEEAMKYGGKVILGDRPVQVTLRRTWARMPLWHKTKLVYSLMFQAVFLPSPEDLNRMLKEMDDVDMLTLVIQEMSKQFPTLMETLVHERDQYMASTLLRVAREHNSVLAVVGKGHLLGMQKYWQQPIEVKELLSLPAQKPAVSVKKILTTVGVAVAGAAILSGIYFSSKK